MHPLLSFRKSFDPQFQSFLAQKIRFSQKTLQDKDLAEILLYTEEMALKGGKRVRPYLASLGYRFVEPRVSPSTQRLFIALELFHLFALVHDDVMDRGTSRYGMPTIHERVASTLSRRTSAVRKRMIDLRHTGESQAILVGDLLFSWCHEAMSPAPDTTRNLFAQMIDEVILGQMIDVNCVTRDEISFDALVRKMKYKTASYTITKPLQIGASLAGGPAQLIKSLDIFGTTLGIAFQIQDDLFDLTLPSTDMKKTVLSDLAEGQHTIFTTFILKHGTHAQQRDLRELFGQSFAEKDRPRIMKLFSESGALEQGEHRLQAYLKKARALAEKLQIASSSKKELLEFIAYLTARTS